MLERLNGQLTLQDTNTFKQSFAQAAQDLGGNSA
jgi:hypothetical protein